MQTSFDGRLPVGYPGMPADVSPTYDQSYCNTALDVAGVVTITVANFTASTEYSLNINNVRVTVTTPATGGTIATLRDSLISAVNQSFAGVDAVVGAGNTFTVTGVAGQPLNVAVETTALTQVVTTPVVTSSEIGLGLAVVRVLTDSDREVRLGAPTSTHRFVGVTVDDNLRTIRLRNYDNKPVYRRGDSMLVREAGTLWVELEAPVTTDSPVYYRYSGSGRIGAFRGNSSAGADVRLTNARFATSGTNLAKLVLGYASITNGTAP